MKDQPRSITNTEDSPKNWKINEIKVNGKRKVRKPSPACAEGTVSRSDTAARIFKVQPCSRRLQSGPPFPLRQVSPPAARATCDTPTTAFRSLPTIGHWVCQEREQHRNSPLSQFGQAPLHEATFPLQTRHAPQRSRQPMISATGEIMRVAPFLESEDVIMRPKFCCGLRCECNLPSLFSEESLL